ncbi:Toll/interleukin-1 receptor domain-containing protein [Tanacetum coccineum]
MASFSSLTSSTQKSFKYDVFISFRGEDVRKNFIAHLSAALKREGIHTFKNDDLPIGEKLAVENQKAIEDSRILIIVFSKNYASSSWCLDELVKIMECHKMTEQIVCPVYIDVEPRHALIEASNLAAWELKNIADGNTALISNAVAIRVSCSRLVATIPFPTSPTDTKRNSVDYIQVGTSLGIKSISKTYAPSSRSNGGVIEYYKTL